MFRRARLQPSTVKSLVMLAVCLAVLACVFSPDRLLLFPTTDPVASVGATRTFIPFYGDWLLADSSTPPRDAAR